MKKQIAEYQDICRRTKETLSNLNKSKNRFKALAIESELAAKQNWGTCAEKVASMEKENDKLRNDVKSMSLVAVSARDTSKDAAREVKQYKEKVVMLEREMEPIKAALAEAEKAHTEVACQLAAAEGR